ncbi:MAG: hypothetical protein HY873_13205 [Chloroflexi bacterium]|nr:hypothetical protein [Chloroflexota bacterium]
MTRGRTPTFDGLLAEARVQAYSVSHELGRHDQWELAALEALDLLLREGDVIGARRVVAELRRRDVVVENPLHREITDVFETADGASRAVAS